MLVRVGSGNGLYEGKNETNAREVVAMPNAKARTKKVSAKSRRLRSFDSSSSDCPSHLPLDRFALLSRKMSVRIVCNSAQHCDWS